MVYFLIAPSFRVVHLVTETHEWALRERARVHLESSNLVCWHIFSSLEK